MANEEHLAILRQGVEVWNKWRKKNYKVLKPDLSGINLSGANLRHAFLGYIPDVLVLNLPNLVNEPLWKKASTVTQAESIPLAVEVVSTNWRDDYFLKFGEYEEIGIPEYWIVDYAALGGKRFIGNPKQPTISVYALVEGEYQVTQFRGNDRIQSPTLRELNLTAEQVFQAALGQY